MGGEIKHRKKITITIDLGNADALDELAQITRIPKSRLVDEALDCLFERHHEAIVEYHKKSFKESIADKSKINWLHKRDDKNDES